MRSLLSKKVQILKVAAVAFASLFLFSCTKPAAIRAPEQVKLDIPEKEITEGSLWQPNAGKAGLIADNVAQQRGDLLTLLVVEDITASQSRSTSTNRTSNTSAQVDKFIYSDYLQRAVGGSAEMPSVSMQSSRSNNGGGDISNTGSVRATLSAQVTEVLPNGNLVVLAQKSVIVSNERQVITVTGIARPQDVTKTNTINSNQLAEARINIHGSGPLNDAQRRTLLTRVFDWINLF